jgi:hypothetical protein
MSESFKKESRKDWVAADGAKPDNEQLRLGCLQRIADATEKMAESYDRMRDSRDWYKSLHESARKREDKLERRIRSLKGVITRMKSKEAT